MTEPPCTDPPGMPLTALQQELWTYHEMHGSRGSYNVPMLFHLDGELDTDRLRHAIERLVARHSAFRLRFAIARDEVRQIVRDTVPISIDVEEIIDPATFSDRLHAASVEPIDIGKGVLGRISLFRRAQDRHALLIPVHHIGFDGWSMLLIESELASLLAGDDTSETDDGYRSAIERQLAMETSQYCSDLAEKVAKAAQGRSRFWHDTEGQGQPVDLAVVRESRKIEGRAFEALREARERFGVSTFELVAASYHLVLSCSLSDDRTDFSIVLNARDGDALDCVGHFTNTLPLVLDDAGCGTVSQLCKTVARGVAEFRSCPAIPPSLLRAGDQAQRAARDASAGIALIQAPPRGRSRAAGSGLSLRRDLADTRRAKFDLAVTLSETRDTLEIVVEGARPLFDEAKIAMLARRLDHIVGALAQSPIDASVAMLDLLPREEHALIDRHGSGETRDWGPAVPLGVLVEQAAARLPDGIAIEDPHDRLRLTYDELATRMRAVANNLAQRGIGANMVVAVEAERGADMIVCLCGISLAGAAFLAIDQADPIAYREGLKRGAGVALVLTEHPVDTGRSDGPETLMIADVLREAKAAPSPHPADAVPGDLAYIVFTSGSTGSPRGAMISHEAIFNRISWMRETFGARRSRRVLHKTPVSFDVYIAETFWPLVSGGTLVLTKPGGHRDPDYLLDLIERSDVSCAHFVPSLLRVLLRHPHIDRCRGRLGLLLTSGEQLDGDLALQARATLHCDMANLYGPAEAAVDVTCQLDIAVSPTEEVTIGRPIANVVVHILDREGRPAPFGSAGEIVVTGAAVGLGYVNAAAPSGFTTIETAHGAVDAYRTGDRGRFLPSGNIAFLGREDRQTKINGQRIELGEVEATLRALPGVRDAAAVVHDGRLLAFVAPFDAGDDIADRRAALAARLPSRMVPHEWIDIDAIPVNRNGKIDYAALERLAAIPRPSSRAPRDAGPLPATSRALAAIWSDVLNREISHRDADFFESGGDSLRAVIVTYKARELGYPLKVEDLYTHTRLGALADVVQSRDSGEARAVAMIDAPFAQIDPVDRKNLPPTAIDAFPVSRLQGALHVHALTDEDYRCYVSSYDVLGPFDGKIFAQAMELTARRHAILRTQFDFTSYSQALQIVVGSVAWTPEIIDARDLTEADFEALLSSQLADLRTMRFDWSRAPLCHVRVHVREGKRFQLTLVEPLLDGWSVAVLVTDLIEAYAGLRDGRFGEQKAPQVSGMAASIAAERAALVDPRARDFWQKRLANVETTAIPVIPGAPLSTRPLREKVPLDADAALADIAETMQVPQAIVLMAIHVEALSLLTGQRMVATAMMTNGRIEESGADRSVGLFLNSLPLIVDTNVDDWQGLIRQIWEMQKEAMPYRRYPFAALRELVDRPITETVFNYTHFWSYARTAEYGFEIASRRASDQTYFPLTVQGATDWRTGRITLELEFAAGLSGGKERAEQIVALYGRVADDLCRNWRRSGRGRPALSAEELDALRAMQGVVDPPGTSWRDFGALFAAAGQETPDAIALSDGVQTCTYAVLERRTRSIALALRRRGVEGSTVAILGKRSVGFVELCIGILRAGAVYLPLDPAWPSARLETVVRLAGVALVLIPDEPVEAPVDFAMVSLADLLRDGNVDVSPGLPPPDPEQPAYILFTSGTTGEPKGARLSHRGLVNHLLAKVEDFEMDAGTVLAQTAEQTFDISIWQMLCPLIVGGRVHVIGADDATSSESLAATVVRERIDMVELVPSTLTLMLEAIETVAIYPAMLAGLRLMVVTGEAFPAALARRWFACVPGVPLANAYGPTECSDDVTHHILRSPADIGTAPVVPIGRPLRNTKLYIVDHRLRPVPLGTPGQLIVAGAGVGIDYVNNPEDTRRAFRDGLPNGLESGRVYCTGDLALIDFQGRAHFLGRLDQQIKINGLRIEPVEIAQRIAAHPAIRAVHVAATSRTGDVDAQLCAYVVSFDSVERPQTDELEGWVARTLPWAIVPRIWQWLDALPVNSNGKIDASRLPQPVRRRGGEPPRSEMEKIVAEVVADVLECHDISRDDRLADLGGNSLGGLRIAARLGRRLSRQVSPRLISANATVAAIAEALGGDMTIASPVAANQTSFTVSSVRGLPDRVDAVALGYFSNEMLARVTEHEGARRAVDLLGGKGDWRRILRTEHGTIAHFICPIDSDTILAGGPGLLDGLLPGFAFAGAIGARTISLTGLLGAAVGKDVLVREALSIRYPGIAVTDGLSVTVPIVAMTVHQALGAVGRSLADEVLACLGCGNVGTGALALLLSGRTGPAPQSVMLCDPWLTPEAAITLEASLRAYSGYGGAIRLLPDRQGRPADEFYMSRTILGATNSPNVLDVGALRSGTVIVDDSSPHCFSADAMLRRILYSGDVFATEGGLVSLPKPIAERGNPAFFAESYFRNFRPDDHSVMGCLLASVLFGKEPKRPNSSKNYSEFENALGVLHHFGYIPAGFHVEDVPIQVSKLNMDAFR